MNNQNQKLYKDIQNHYSKSLGFSSLFTNSSFGLNLRPSFTQRIILRPLQFGSAMALYVCGKYLQSINSMASLVQANMYKSAFQTFAGVFFLTSLHTGIQEIIHGFMRKKLFKINLTPDAQQNDMSKLGNNVDYDGKSGINNNQYKQYSGFVISNALASLTLFPFVNIFFGHKIKKDLLLIDPEMRNKQIHIQNVIQNGSAIIRTHKILLLLTLYGIFSDFFITFKREQYLDKKGEQSESIIQRFFNRQKARSQRNKTQKTKSTQLNQQISKFLTAYYDLRIRREENEVKKRE